MDVKCGLKLMSLYLKPSFKESATYCDVTLYIITCCRQSILSLITDLLLLYVYVNYMFQGADKYWFVIIVGSVILFQCLATDIFVFNAGEHLDATTTVLPHTTPHNTTHSTPTTTPHK